MKPGKSSKKVDGHPCANAFPLTVGPEARELSSLAQGGTGLDKQVYRVGYGRAVIWHGRLESEISLLEQQPRSA